MEGSGALPHTNMVSAGLILLDALIFFSDLANAGSYVIILAFVSQKRSVAGSRPFSSKSRPQESR